MGSKWYMATLTSPVLPVDNVSQFCLDMRIILLSKMYIKMNYITYSGQLVKDQEVFTRNKPSGDNWNQWKMEIVKPENAMKLVFNFGIRIRKDGVGIAVLIDSLNVLFGTCDHANDEPNSAGADQKGEYIM